MTDPTRPQPVVKEFDIQGAASGLIVAVGSIVFIVKAGITTGNLLTLGNLVGTALSIIAGAALWYSHRKAGQNAAAQVTPLESPRDYAGNELLTIDQWERAALRRGKHSEFNAAPPAPKPTPYARLRHDEDNRFCYSSADFAKLLANQGDATVFVPITQPAPTPTPVPTPGPAQPIPAPKWVKWARHTLTLKGQSRLTDEVATEIVAAANL